MKYLELPRDLQTFIDQGLVDLKMANELSTLKEIPADNVAHTQYDARGGALSRNARLKAQRARCASYKSVPGCCCPERRNYASRGLPDAWEAYRQKRDLIKASNEKPLTGRPSAAKLFE